MFYAEDLKLTLSFKNIWNTSALGLPVPGAVGSSSRRAWLSLWPQVSFWAGSVVVVQGMEHSSESQQCPEAGVPGWSKG